MDPKKIAALSSTREDEAFAEDMLSNIPSEMKKSLSFINLKMNPEESLGDFSARCIEKVKREKIDHVISLTDTMAIVHAKICSGIPKIRGPSLDSVMAAMDKYRARKYLMENGGGVRYARLDFNATSTDISEAVKHVGLPAILKPVCSHDSIGLVEINDKNEIQPNLKMIEKIKLKYKEQCDFSGFYDVANDENSAILEEFVKSESIASVEGCVVSGNTIHWAITDTVFWPSRPSAILGCIYPSQYSKTLQDEIWRQFDYIVKKMIHLGFDNQFVHVEMFIMPDNGIKIIEINHRLSTLVGPLYRECLHGGNVGIALINLSHGVIPEIPRSNNIFGLGGQLVTFKSGKAKDLIDFDRAKLMAGVLMTKHSNEDVFYLGDDGGCVMAIVSTFGFDIKDVFEEFISKLRRILKHPEYGPVEITDGINEEFIKNYAN